MYPATPRGAGRLSDGFEVHTDPPKARIRICRSSSRMQHGKTGRGAPELAYCMAAGLLFGAIAAMTVLWLSNRHENQMRRDVTVLVLPFDNVSASQAGPEFQEIASDQLIAKLAEMDPKHLRVIDPLTARKFKNTKQCIIEIGNSLGADYVVVGEVDPSMEAVKVHAQLFQVSTNRQVWASEGELPRRPGYSAVWDSMSEGIGAQLRHVARLSN